jgi:ribosomal protein S18 acetylase RimI-like enzyme
MFLYELGVDALFRGRGIGQPLVSALAGLARERGGDGMWVLTDHDNAAALATYPSRRKASKSCSGGPSSRHDYIGNRRRVKQVNTAATALKIRMAGIQDRFCPRWR